MTNDFGKLSDGSKPPALPKWFNYVLMSVVIGLFAAMTYSIGYIVVFGRELRQGN